MPKIKQRVKSFLPKPIINKVQQAKKLWLLIKNGEFSELWKRVMNYQSPKKRDSQELMRLLDDKFELDTNFEDNKINVSLFLRAGKIRPQSSAYIRLISPLSSKSAKSRVAVKIMPGNTTKPDKNTDICIVQRTAIKNERAARKLIRNINKSGVKLIVDTDDAFAQLDKSHSQYKEQFKRAEALKLIVDVADEVWFSTAALSDLYSVAKDKSVIMRNSLDKRLWQESENTTSTAGLPLQMTYMGTPTHDDDLAMVMPALERLAEKYPGKFHLTIIGVVSSKLESEWITFMPPPREDSIYPRFVNWFMNYKAFDVGLSPLEDIEFNRSKSDIKCLDYLAAGITPIVSDIKPYQNSEIEKFIKKVPNDIKQWERTLEEVIANPDLFRENQRKIMPKAQQYIWQERSSDNIAQKMLERMNNLLSSG